MKPIHACIALAALVAPVLSRAQDSCRSNGACPPGSYCAKEAGDCDGAGACLPRPTFCPMYFDPVCGCDGQTYGNSCEAAAAGVNVAYRGPCLTPECTGNKDCGDSFYCYFGNCSDEAGVCRQRPFACPEIWDPVCGCDGQTYGNACEAAVAGVSVAHRGPCQAHCFGNSDCDPEHYCLFAGCAAETGICAERPSACLDVWDPVCGCDGRTYSNACYAAMAGVTVDYDGPCVKMCTGNEDCDDNHYCRKESCADETGVCELRPQACPRLWDPVCGCDGKTYANECEAARAGVNVAHKGPCPPICASSGDCPVDDYCRKVGCNDPAGACETRPMACPDVWMPVCGCDGQTYGNACEAAAAGVNVAYPGECLPRGPQPLMLEPQTLDDDVHTGTMGVPHVRVLWSEPVRFTQADVSIADEDGHPVAFTALGNLSPIVLVFFHQPLLHDRYVVTVADSATGLMGEPIDGDRDNVAGGKAVIVIEHRKRHDADNNNLIDLEDLANIAAAWLWQG